MHEPIDTTVINFFAGPGSGKSTTATGLFSRLKQEGHLAEYVSEYAKDVTWEGTHKLLENQLHIFSEQFRRQWRLQGKVRYVITDSPLLLSGVYYQHYRDAPGQSVRYTKAFGDALLRTIDEAYNSFNNVNVFIFRDKPYVQVGRSQEMEEADAISTEVLDFIADRGVPYITARSSDAIETTYRHIKKLHGI